MALSACWLSMVGGGTNIGDTTVGRYNGGSGWNGVEVVVSEKQSTPKKETPFFPLSHTCSQKTLSALSFGWLGPVRSRCGVVHGIQKVCSNIPHSGVWNRVGFLCYICIIQVKTCKTRAIEARV
jgi:hypothetical protein